MTETNEAPTGTEELVFLKLGGSLITDKTRPLHLRANILRELAKEIAYALSVRPGLQLLIGHGSGSFGHVVAREHSTRDGVSSPEGWRGFAATARVAAQLNRHVMDALWEANVGVLSVPPSASAMCHGGELKTMDTRPIDMALSKGLVPVVYGDVALDDLLGGTIVSTEELFRWLAPRYRPRRILLTGEVEGVLAANPFSGDSADLIHEITVENLPRIEVVLGASRGTDVTGGMLAKVREMARLIEELPELESVQILSGMASGQLQQVLLDPLSQQGTVIRR